MERIPGSFSEKVSRKLNRRIVMLCGVVFLICMMLTVALYSDSFQSFIIYQGIAAEDIKVEEVYQLKNGRLYVHVKSKTQNPPTGRLILRQI